MRRFWTTIALTSLVVMVPALAWGQAPASSTGALPSSEEARELKLAALQTIGKVLFDPTRSEADRLNAATVLVRVGDRTVMPLLLQELLGDPFPSVRRVVAEGLGNYQAPEAAFSLRQAALTAPIDSVRWASAVSLVRTDPLEGDIIRQLLQERDTLAAAALSLQDATFVAGLPEAFHGMVIAAFTEAIPDRRMYNSVERAAMLKALGEFGSREAIRLLLDTLNNLEEDPFVRGAAGFALGLLEAQQALGALVAVLDSGDDALQVGALSGLGQLQNPAAIEPVVRLLQNEDSAEIRAAAVAALSAFGADTRDVLIETLNNDPDPNVRQAAVAGLAAIGDETATQAVVDFVGGDYLLSCDPAACSGLALETLSALAQLDQGDLALQLLSVSLDALVDTLPFVFAFAEADLIDVAVEIGQVAPEVIDLLLSHDNPFVQAIALGALPQVKGEFSRATLLKFVDPDAHRLLRRMAFEGLAQFATPQDTELFAAELFNRDRRTRGAAFSVLSSVGDERALDAIFEALNAEDLAIQLQAIEAACLYGDRILALQELPA